jgi:hypothetical protein
MENGSWEQLPIGSIGLQNDIRPAVLSQTFLTKAGEKVLRKELGEYLGGSEPKIRGHLGVGFSLVGGWLGAGQGGEHQGKYLDRTCPVTSSSHWASATPPLLSLSISFSHPPPPSLQDPVHQKLQSHLLFQSVSRARSYPAPSLAPPPVKSLSALGK